MFCGGKLIRGCFIVAKSVFCYQPFHGYSVLTASEVCGRHEHPVGSSVAVSDSTVNWNVDEQINFNVGVFQCGVVRKSFCAKTSLHF
jgi:hypothetical protein